MLVNPGSAFGELNDGDCVRTHLLHFDPLGNLTTHGKSSIHRKIVILMNKLWDNQSPPSSCETPFTSVTMKNYSPEGLLNMSFIKISFTLISTDFSFAVPQETLEQDSTIYLQLYVHGYFLFHNLIHTSTYEDVNAKFLLSSSDEFTSIPLDADRLHAEMLLLIKRLAKMFVNN